MKRKLIACLLVMSSIVSLTACGKEDVVEPSTTEQHYYEQEIVDILPNTNEDLENPEDAGYIYYEAEPELIHDYMDVDNNSYDYPYYAGDPYLVNGVAMGYPLDHGFLYNGVSMNQYSDGLDQISKYSVDNHLFCPGYKSSQLTDLKLDAYGDNQSLYYVYAAIDKIKLGNLEYTIADLNYSLDDIDKLWGFLYSTFELVPPEIGEDAEIPTVDPTNPFINEYAEYNDYGGLTYSWKFTSQAYDEYSTEEIESYKGRGYDPSNTYVLDVAFNAVGEPIFYTLRYYKAPHIVILEYIDNDDDPETPVVESLEYAILGQNGYCYDNSYMKMKDGTIIGLDTFSITIHDKENYSRPDDIIFSLEEHTAE